MQRCQSYWMVLLVLGGIAVRGEHRASAQDWPTYLANGQRNAVTNDSLEVDRLQPAWSWQSYAAPRPAWGGPAKWDAYSYIRDLKSMRNYDPVFFPIIAQGRVYFSSTVDDSVHCLDGSSGEAIWKVTTDAPVRIAPTWHDGRIYFGSDDGFAYCVDALTGEIQWRFSPDPDAIRIINNGRLISPWPVRTGVVVHEGIAYFAASMLPWKKSYLCAVDADSGVVAGDGAYMIELERQTMEGPMLVSPERLIIPQGRVAPTLFSRHDGKPLGSLRGGGGSFVVLVRDSQVFHGPGNKTGWITASDSRTLETVATYRDAKAMVVDDSQSFMLTNSQLIASDFDKREMLWNSECRHSLALIKAGETLILGGDREVAFVDAANGQVLRKLPVAGRAFGLAVSEGRLYVATDEGTLQVFAAGKIGTDSTQAEVSADANRDSTAFAPADVQPIEHDQLLGRWAFQRQYMNDGRILDLTGRNHATVSGTPQLARWGKHEGLMLEKGRSRVLVAQRHRDAELPREQMTVAAWVRIDEPQSWGGIIGAIQDNGAYEKGWLLGFRHQQFCLAISSEDGPGRLTYMTAPNDFETGRWYHVAGTYDGETMKLFVDGQVVNSSDEQSGAIAYPPTAFYEIGAYHDNDEDFPITGQIHEASVFGAALSAEAIAALSAHIERPDSRHIRLAQGPFLRFVSPSVAEIHYQTIEPCPTRIRFGSGPQARIIRGADGNRTEHAVRVEGLRRDQAYDYAVLISAGQAAFELEASPVECDTAFNYTSASIPSMSSPFGESSDGARARLDLLEQQTTFERGLCLVIGCGEGALAHEISKSGAMRVVGVDESVDAINTGRRQLGNDGLYGVRTTLHAVDHYASIPWTGEAFNVVIVCEKAIQDDKRNRFILEEAIRLAVPGQGRVIVWRNPDVNIEDALRDSVDADGIASQFSWEGPSGSTDTAFLIGTRQPLPGSGDWTHLYGKPDNAAFGGETLAGARSQEDLQVQWVGRPGARYQPDRSGRKPAPLSANGRLFLQGLERLIALDAFNGTVLWSWELPELGRFNMPRDCSNWCIDGDRVYVAWRDRCLIFDAASGDLLGARQVVTPPRLLNAENHFHTEWGYVAREGDLLIGSAVRENTAFTNFWGNADQGWYDARGGDATAKVCSDVLFAFRDGRPEPAWVLSSGLIINSTVTIADNHIYFVENRQPDRIAGEARRFFDDAFWQDLHLVCADLSSGTPVWEKPLDVEPGGIVFFLAHGQEHLVLLSSNRDRFFTYAINPRDGEFIWNNEVPWPQNHHGGHMSRPAIVGNRLFVRPAVMELATGRLLDIKMPGGGCGTYACASDAVFFRSGNVTMWDAHTGNSTSWHRLRPDCWLSTIPANGMLLSPEGGGGCSCGSWMETSIGFKPRSLLPIK